MNVAIIGSGLAGSILSKALEGRANVTLFDDADPWRASRASENLYFPHTPSRASENLYFPLSGDTWNGPGLEFLAHHYGLTQITFNRGANTAYHVPLEQILRPADVRDSVSAVYSKPDGVTLKTVIAQETHTFDYAVVCAGVRTSQLLDVPMRSQTGHRLLYRCELAEPLYEVYRPYHSSKAFSIGGGLVSFGDATGIFLESYRKRMAELLEQTKARAAKWNLTGLEEVQYGNRPYGREHPLKSYGNFGRVFYMTGGRKMGMMAYSINSVKIADQICSGKK